MTNTEALESVLDGLSFSDNALEKALLDQSITALDPYTVSNGKSIDLAAVELLLVSYTKADFQEGGMQLSHPDFLRKIRERLLYLATKHNLQPILEQLNPKPKVTGRSPW